MTNPSKIYQQQQKHRSPEALDARIVAAAKEQAEINAEENRGASWNWMPTAATTAVLLVGITFIFNTDIFVSNSTEPDLFSESASSVLAPEIVPAAQNSLDDFVDENAAPVKIEEVVVTARKRDESLQDVPISISVVSTDDTVVLEEGDLADLVPGLYYSGDDQESTITTASARVRSSEEPSIDADTNVSTEEYRLDEVIVTSTRQERSSALGRTQAGLFSREDMEPDLIEITTQIPGIILDIYYAGAENFVGESIDGYESEKALLSEPAILALIAVQNELRGQGLSLKIFDAYRPQRAVDHFIHWSQSEDQSTKETYYPNIEKSELFNAGYLAEQSSHSRGSTVDLTIVRMNPDGSHEELDMGTIFDFFDPKSWPSSSEVSETAQQNRQLLRDIMTKHGFEPFDTEWWHFTLKNEPYPNRYFDLPVE